MLRKHGTNSRGGSFSEETKKAVWQKGQTIQGRDPAEFRFDKCKAIIAYSKYGDTTEGGNGWEIDHIKPVSMGGTDDLSNLQPLQWQNNRRKSDNYPSSPFDCAVTYE